jgi:hypothetical protein
MRDARRRLNEHVDSFCVSLQIINSSSNGFQSPVSSPGPFTNSTTMSRGEQWLGSLTASVGASQPPQQPPPRRPPTVPSHTRSHSLGSPPDGVLTPNILPGAPAQPSLPTIPPRSPFHIGQVVSSPPAPSALSNRTNPLIADPFDAEWAALATRSPSSTNPFLQNSVVKTFEVHM